MKLDPGAQRLAEISLLAKVNELANGRPQKLRQIQAIAGPNSPATPEFIDYHINTAQEIIDAKIEYVITGYRKVNQPVDDDDKNEILEYIKMIIEKSLERSLSDGTIIELRSPVSAERKTQLTDYITRRFRNLLGNAAMKLTVAITELNLDISQSDKQPYSP